MFLMFTKGALGGVHQTFSIGWFSNQVGMPTDLGDVPTLDEPRVVFGYWNNKVVMVCWKLETIMGPFSDSGFRSATHVKLNSPMESNVFLQPETM